MKEIKAYIRDQMRDAVVDAIEAMPDAPSVIWTAVRAFGHPKTEGPAKRVERTKLEMVVPDDRVEEVVDCILNHARTGEGHLGDGDIYITELQTAIRIDSGERKV